MNHDITHCKGDNCSQKDSCYRYLAYLECIAGKYDLPVSIFLDNKDCIDNEYKMKITE